MNATQLSTIDQPVQESSARCQHRTLKGRCRQAATDNAGTLCFHHARAQRQAKDDFNLLELLVRKTEDLQSIEGIGEHLATLQNLLAEGRISPRRASVIAYIDSLLLRTVTELDQRTEGSLNYYGQPVRPFDYSSLEPQTDPAKAGSPNANSAPAPILDTAAKDSAASDDPRRPQFCDV